MLAIAGNLALKPVEAPPRTLVTPGQLYRMLSAALREQRPARCGCRMPMVTARMHEGEGANWQLEPHRRCPRCAPLVARLVSQYSENYDMLI